MNDREQIISFLLQSGDNKDRVIADLQKQITELRQQLDLIVKTAEPLDKITLDTKPAKPNGVDKTAKPLVMPPAVSVNPGK